MALQFLYISSRKSKTLTTFTVSLAWQCNHILTDNCSGLCMLAHWYWHLEIYSLGSRQGSSRPADLYKQEHDGACPSGTSRYTTHPKTSGKDNTDGRRQEVRGAWDKRRNLGKWADEWQSRRLQTNTQRGLVLSLLLGWLYKSTGVERGDVNVLRALHASP